MKIVVRFQMECEIERGRLVDLFLTAFEGGGSQYWAEEVRGVWKDQEAGLSWWEKLELEEGDLGVPGWLKPLFSPFGELEVVYYEGPDLSTKRMNLAQVERGLNLLAEKERRHFLDIVNENDDADTADMFVQMSLFGEIVYC